jgi:hypothetical protein
MTRNLSGTVRDHRPRQKGRNLVIGRLHSQKTALTGTKGLTGFIPGESPLMGNSALTGKKGFTGLVPAESALTGKRGPNWQNVEKIKVRMADLETLGGCSKLLSLGSRQPQLQPMPKGESVGLPDAGKFCSPDPWKQTRLPGESNLPPELKTEVKVSSGKSKYVPALSTYISHVNGNLATQVSMLMEQNSTRPNQANKKTHPHGDLKTRVKKPNEQKDPHGLLETRPEMVNKQKDKHWLLNTSPNKANKNRKPTGNRTTKGTQPTHQRGNTTWKLLMILLGFLILANAMTRGKNRLWRTKQNI